MLSIGEFARFAGVSVRMLRHYDALGLLVPADVDDTTGYRRYTAAQLPRLNRLVALKELGFTLEQVSPILEAEVGPAELRAMLTLRRAQVSAQIAADQGRLAEIERRLRSIEKEGLMSDNEYVEKLLPAVRVAQLVDTVGAQEEIGARIGPMFQNLGASLGAAGISMAEPAIAWYQGTDDGMRIAAAWPTTVEAVPSAPQVEIAELAAAPKAVTVIHHGSMDTLGDAWQALVKYVADKGYTPAGPGREVYLDMPMDDPQSCVTELQQPVA